MTCGKFKFAFDINFNHFGLIYLHWNETFLRPIYKKLRMHLNLQYIKFIYYSVYYSFFFYGQFA